MSRAPARTFAQNHPPLRPVELGPADVLIERRSDGAILMRSPHPLPAHPQKLTERLLHWAKAAPDRVFLAERDPGGGWRMLTYAQTLVAVRAIAMALLQRDLSTDRPIAILSGNDIEHALISLAAMHVGIPYAPISVPYSLLSQDFGKLKTIMAALSPGLVFAANGTAFARAITAAAPRSWSPPRRRRAAARLTSPHWRRHSRRRRSRPPTPKSVPIRLRNSCSLRVRPASRKASSTRSACCAPTRR